MTLLIDDRAGSAPLAPMLRRLGMEVELTRMEFGDIAFFGKAQNADPVSVGIEVKSLADAMGCLVSGRFAGHQLPGMVSSYDHIWLLIQGVWREHPATGILEELRAGRGGGSYWAEAEGGGQRRWLARDFESWLLSVSILGGMRVHRVDTWEQGAKWVKLLANWYAKDEHKSIQVVYSGKRLYPDNALLGRPSLARRWAKELTGIGVKGSADIARVLTTGESIARASVEDWAKMEIVDKSGNSRVLGKARAHKIWKEIHGNGSGGSNGNGNGGTGNGH